MRRLRDHPLTGVPAPRRAGEEVGECRVGGKGSDMTGSGSGRGPTPVGPRGALAAAGALAVGLWLGVAVGLATRRRRDQPGGPLVYDRPDGVGASPQPAD